MGLAIEGARERLDSPLLLKEGSDHRDDKIGGGALLGTGIGLLAGGALAQVTDYRPGDVGQMLLFSQLGKALGAGSVLLTDPDDGDPVLVGLLLGTTAGLVTAATVGRPLRYQGGDAPMDGEDVALATAIGGDVGAALTALLVSPTVGLDPLVIGGANLGGIALAGVFTMGAMMVTEDHDAWIRANIAGSALGLLGGGLLAHGLLDGRRRPARNKTADTGEASEFKWLRGLAAVPLMDRDGRVEGVALTVQGVL